MAPTRHTALAALAALLLPGVCARRRPDLGVSITQDGPQLISDFTRFEVAVRNLGNRRVDAGDAEITITLPTTNTSPNVHVLGELGSKSSACALTASGLGYVCSLPRIDKAGGANDVATLFFELKVPQSSAQIEIVAELSKVPRREVTPANNRGTIVPEQLFTSPAVNPPSPRTVVLRHCTGQDLTSFFECEASPSSISTHTGARACGGPRAPRRGHRHGHMLRRVCDPCAPVLGALA